MRSIYLIIIVIPSFLFGQNGSSPDAIRKTEVQLDSMYNSLFNMVDSPERDSLNQEIIRMFTGSLQSFEGFYYPWPTLKNIGKVASEENELKIFTWHLQGEDGSYSYFGLLVHAVSKKKRKMPREFRVLFLKDKSGELKNPEYQILTEDNWYGCLYYRMHVFRHRKNDFCVLFGYDLNDAFSNVKILDILTLNRRLEPEFGGVIHYQDDKLKRLLFEYSEQTVMSVRYDRRLDMIVWDHLSPFEPVFEGNSRFYGPDGSYDGLRFGKGDFFVEEDVDARNQ